MMAAYDNRAYTATDDNFDIVELENFEEDKKIPNHELTNGTAKKGEEISNKKKFPEPEKRDVWGKDIEFLMSCIALSVGLGNVWRFPFIAMDNGGGAFLIPYIVVLFLVGRPIYYLEMIMGQFSSRGAVQLYDLCPSMRGIGITQILATFAVGTYYASLSAIIGYFLVNSFVDPLPWAQCRADWGSNCINSDGTSNKLDIYKALMSSNPISSSEYYFERIVLKEKDSINDGIGAPNIYLVIGLFVTWVFVFICTFRGVQSSGKASYFLAIFPYIVLIILLIRAVTLEGAGEGILFFLTPKWEKLWDAQVWYAAVTQVFFSLSVCFGSIISYSSFNRFQNNVHRDVVVVAYLDTITSLVSGLTIFGVLGNLAHNLGTKDIASVVKGGPGLAFISYPEAISKFTLVPQLFSVLFFLMLFVLAIGSIVGMSTCCIRAVRDYFPRINQWQGSILMSVVSFALGLVYVTPGGQFMLNLIDQYAGAMMVLVVGILELYILGWVYGVQRICKDTGMMINNKPGWYWRSCWGVITPILMTIILIYSYATYKPLTYKNEEYPTWAIAIGWTCFSIGLAQIPIWMIVAMVNYPGKTLKARFLGSFLPTKNWGPWEADKKVLYESEVQTSVKPEGAWNYIKHNLTD